MIARSPSSWYQTLRDQQGLQRRRRASTSRSINGDGLVGKVKTRLGGNAVVMLLTDPEFGVSGPGAEAASPAASARGRRARRPAASSSCRTPSRCARATSSSPAGHRAAQPPARRCYPRGILIGTVKRVEIGEGELDRAIHVKPAADLRTSTSSQVLTEPHADLRARQAP